MIHLNSDLRLSETITFLSKWVGIAQSLDLDCCLVDNTLQLPKLQEVIPRSLQPKVRLLSAPPVEEDLLQIGGAGIGEILSMKFALAQLQLNPQDLVFKSNARYFVRNMKTIVELTNPEVPINFFTYGLVCRAETKFFAISAEHFAKFIDFAEPLMHKSSSLHLEHLFAQYIAGPGYLYSSHFRVPPVLEGKSGRFGTKYSFISESRINHLTFKFFKSFRKFSSRVFSTKQQSNP